VSALSLAGRVLAIEEALIKADVPHAFGGALSLAYYAEPRATIDIDLNVFVPTDRFTDVAAPLARLGAAVHEPAIETIVRRDGQVRVMWDKIPIDLFFSYDAFHQAAAAAVRSVPFGNDTIPILAADHLMVCKVIFDRLRDWVDIEAMLAAGADINAAEVLRWVARIAGDEDPRYDRIAALLSRRS
jgi:hypothetical protein